MSETLSRDSALRAKVPITLQIAIMCVPLLQMGIAVMTPVLANIQAAFPDIPLTTINLVQTMPNLCMMPMALIAGVIAGRGKIGYKKLVLVAVALWTIGGLVPFFFPDSFYTLLTCRAIFGIGSGIIFPMGQMLVYNYVEDKSRHARILSNNTLAMNLGGCFFQYAAGFLALIAWNYVFLCYLLGIVSFILILIWLKDPGNEFASERMKAVGDSSATKQLPLGESFKRIPAFLWIVMVFYGLSVVLNTPCTMLVSQYVMDHGGTSVDASSVLVVYTVAGLVMGVIFPYVYKVFGRFSIAVGLAVEAIGYLIMFFGGSTLMCGVGEFFQGCGLIIFMPALQKEIAQFCPKGADTVSSGIMMCLMNVGMFVGGYWAALACGIIGSDNLFDCWWISAICLFVLMFIVIATHAKDRPEFHDKPAGAQA